MALQAGMEPGVERSSIRLRYDSMKSLRLTRVADVFFALLVFALLFAMHSRWVFSHFSSDAYLVRLCHFGRFPNESASDHN
jgi:hypothetical protein